MRTRKSMGFVEKCLWAQNRGQGHVLLTYRSTGNAFTLLDETIGEIICGTFRSMNAHAQPQRFKLRGAGNLSKNQGPLQRRLQPMEKCKQVRKHEYTFTTWSSSWRSKSSQALQSCHQANCEEHGYTDEWASGQNQHLTKRWEENPMQGGKCRSLSGPWTIIEFQHKLLFDIPPQDSWRGITIGHRETGCKTFRNGWRSSQKISKVQKCLHPHTFLMTPIRERSHKSGAAHSSRESDLEHLVEVATKSRKHCIYTHFPKDRNCEDCKRTKITKASCRRRTGEAVPRAEKFGDFINSGSQSPQWGGDSRNNHRYAVVVQDLATQWIQSYQCKTKTSQETDTSLRRFLEPSQKPKVIYTDNSLEFGKFCEELSWNHRTSTPHRSETNGIAERAVRRVKEGTSTVLLAKVPGTR